MSLDNSKPRFDMDSAIVKLRLAQKLIAVVCIDVLNSRDVIADYEIAGISGYLDMHIFKYACSMKGSLDKMHDEFYQRSIAKETEGLLDYSQELKTLGFLDEGDTLKEIIYSLKALGFHTMQLNDRLSGVDLKGITALAMGIYEDMKKKPADFRDNNPAETISEDKPAQNELSQCLL